MKIHIEIDEEKLKELVHKELVSLLGDMPFNKGDIKIQVRSKQNYRSEWETAEFKAVLDI